MTRAELIDALETAQGVDSCTGCDHASGPYCLRDQRKIGDMPLAPFSQDYETRYDDSDFCGPQRRYYTPACSLFQRFTNALAAACLRAGGE